MRHLVGELKVRAMATIELTEANFEQTVDANETVIVDFWAEWCGPCKAIAPVLEELDGEYQDRLKIAKMDVDANSKTPQKFGIRSIPTLILFKNGVVEAQHVGAASRKQLKDFLDTNL